MKKVLEETKRLKGKRFIALGVGPGEKPKEAH